MKLSNSLVKLPQISHAMREMSMEMTKASNLLSHSYALSLMCKQAGIMEEMLEEVMQMEDDEELEEEADAEVEKVLFEITDGKLGAAGTVKDELPVSFNFRALFIFIVSLISICRLRQRALAQKRRETWSSIRSSLMSF